MATLRAPEFSSGIPEGIAPLSTAEEQAGILRGIGRKRPDGASLVLEGGLRLEPWERVLLHREARRSRDLRDVKGTALTLLRARAAEWAILRRIEAPDLDLKAAESASLLLDRTLSDIGAATDLDDENHAGFDSIAERLHVLYDRVAATSLRLAMARPVDPAAMAVADLGEDFFELAQLGEHRAPAARETRIHAVPALDAEAEADAFEIEAGDLERAPSAPPAPLPVPVASLSDLDGLDLTFAVGEPVSFAAETPETAETTAPVAAAAEADDAFAAYEVGSAKFGADVAEGDVTAEDIAIDAEVALVATAPPEYEPALAPEPYPAAPPELPVPASAPPAEPEAEPEPDVFDLAPQVPTGRDEVDLFPPLPVVASAPVAAIAPVAPAVRESERAVEKPAASAPAPVAAPAVVMIAPRSEAKRTSPLLYLGIAAVVIAVAVAALLLR